MLNRELARGFAGWLAAFATTAVMAKGLGHMMHREQSKAWRGWLGMIEERAATLQLLRKGLSFMINRELARGFAGWVSSFATTAVMAKGLGHMMHREQSRAWRGWLGMIEERAATMQLLRKGLSFMVNSKLALGFFTWRSNLSGKRDDPMS